MAQTAAKSVSSGDFQDYTPGSAVTGGQIVEVGSRAFPVAVDLAASELGAVPLFGIWDCPKATGAISVGTAVYWDNDGSPVTGTALSGAATGTSSGNTFLGYATAAAASGDSYVRVRITDGPTTGIVFTPEAVAAAGSAQGDAAAVGASTGFVHGTGADGTKGIKLPTAAAGKVLIVKNSDAANAILKVYPGTSQAINALSANAAISMAAKTSAVFVALDATTWYTVPLLPS